MAIVTVVRVAKKCIHCKREKGWHKAKTFHCPFGRGGHPQFRADQVFTLNKPSLKASKRAHRTGALTKAAAIYWASVKKYAVFKEVGVIRRGRRRADILAVNWYGGIIIAEVKSGIADLRSDKKMHNYQGYCNAFYLVVGLDTWNLIKKKGYSLPEGTGVLALGPSGILRSVKRAKRRDLSDKVVRDTMMRMVWRSATHTKLNTRKERVSLNPRS